MICPQLSRSTLGEMKQLFLSHISVIFLDPYATSLKTGGCLYYFVIYFLIERIDLSSPRETTSNGPSQLFTSGLF